MINYIKKTLDEIKVYDCDLTKIRIGNRHDGGYIVATELCNQIENVYSFGIGNDVSFEIHMSERFKNIKQFNLYDPTIDCLPVEHEKFKFYQRGVGNGYGKIRDIESNSMLKLDVEWNEWDAINDISENDLKKFKQIIMEIHLIHAEMSDSLSPYFTTFYKMSLSKINNNIFKAYYHAIEKLLKHFYIFHIHANNSLPKIKVNNSLFPPLIELSLVRKDLVKNAEPTESNFPVLGLDYPNKTDRVDIACYYPLGN